MSKDNYANESEENNITENNSGDGGLEKESPDRKKKTGKQAIKFLLFSVSAGVIQILSDTLMLEVFSFAAWLSYLIALVLSVLWNFTFNRKFTFHSTSNLPLAMLKVATYYCVFTPVSTLWTKYLTETALWNEYIVLALTMAINFITEFLYQKFFVFKEKPEASA